MRDTFYDIFEDLSRHIVLSAVHLLRVAEGLPQPEPSFEHVQGRRRGAEKSEYTVLEQLGRTFITPFDREDMHTLATGLDDVLDTIDTAARRLPMHHTRPMAPAFQRLAGVLEQAAVALDGAVRHLRGKRNLPELSHRIAEIHRLAKVGNDSNSAAVSDMFLQKTDPLELLRWKDLYNLVENAVLSCQAVAHTLERIVLRNA